MPDLTPRAQAEAQARREREAAALRENLRRRKQQARLQDADMGETPDFATCDDRQLKLPTECL